MRIRQFIAALMVLLSLTALARTALACGMMPGGAVAACCCPGEGGDHGASGAAGGTCCDQAVPADVAVAHLAAAKAVRHALADAPMAGPAPYLLPAAFDTGDRSPPPRLRAAASASPLPLYLVTARLRL